MNQGTIPGQLLSLWSSTGEVPGLALEGWVERQYPGVRDAGFHAVLRSFEEEGFLPEDRTIAARLIIELGAIFPIDDTLANFCARAPWRRGEAVFARLELLVALQSPWRRMLAQILRDLELRRPGELAAALPTDYEGMDDSEFVDDFFDPAAVRLLEADGLLRVAERYGESAWRSTGEVRRAFERFRHPDEPPSIPARPGTELVS